MYLLASPPTPPPSLPTYGSMNGDVQLVTEISGELDQHVYVSDLAKEVKQERVQ